MQPAKKNFLHTKGAIIFYEIIDETLTSIKTPETIVFCHGVATNCEMWSEWVSSLSPYFKIIRFDTRGFGRSKLTDVSIPWTMELLAEDILQVANAAGVQSFHLVGESMGGTACLHLATRKNHPLISLTCVSTSHFGGRVQKVGSWREEIEQSGIDAWSEEMMKRRFFPNKLSKEQWDWFSKTQKETDAKALLNGGELLMRTDLSKDLNKIDIPVLLIAPDSSPFIPVEIPMEMHQKIKHSKLIVVPQSRHGLPYSHAKECSQYLLDFLKEQKI
jgi:pimeloyl-ACP methyl ester carboxylesterase